MKSRLTFSNVVFVLLFLILLTAVPSSLRYAYHHGGFYLLSRQFLIDLPKRLNGAGRFRFILQPVAAIFLGIRAGIADARIGRPPYIFGVVFDPRSRWALLKEGFTQISTLVGMGILLDAISQFFILRAIYPGAAVVVGPVLIAIPYALSRAGANRWLQARKAAS